MRYPLYLNTMPESSDYGFRTVVKIVVKSSTFWQYSVVGKRCVVVEACVSTNLICLDDRGLESQIQEEFGAVRIMVSQPDGSWRSLWRLSSSEFAAAGSLDAAMKLIEDALVVLPHEWQHDWLLSIPSCDRQGFAIEVMQCHDCVRAWFGGLEEEFATQVDALSWVARALSGDYELHTTMVGGLGRATQRSGSAPCEA